MTNFKNGYDELYNHVIHHFLEVEGVYNSEIKKEILGSILPEYLYVEQYDKFSEVIDELYLWTNSKLDYYMGLYHEYTLYYFLEYISDIQKSDENFNDIYFDKKAHRLIDEISKQEHFEDPMFSIEECKKIYYSVHDYADDLFEDTDFEFLEDIYNQTKEGISSLANRLGINIDYYFDLLPSAIKKEFKTKNITITGNISSFLNFISSKINYGSLSKLFWNGKTPADNFKMQLIIDNMLTAYYSKQEIEILWEPKIKNNIVEFEIYKRNETDKKVLIQLRKVDEKYSEENFEDYLLKKQ